MKRLSLPAIALLFTIPFYASAQNTPATQVKNTGTDDLPKVEVNNITIGNMAYAKKVLQAWKDYDNNTLDNSAAIFADDLMVTLPDGTVIKGKAAAIKAIKDYRTSQGTVSSDIKAVTTLKSPDEPEHEVVSIWGLETATAKDGTVTKTHLNELWFFNKEGKVARMHQMAAKELGEKK